MIEKDWCSFGHRFQDRIGHGSDPAELPDERCPVFLQFLDCLYQLITQFPRAFEYNEELLIFLADHSSSCLFGNFLRNCEQERMMDNIPEKTKCIWEYIHVNKARFQSMPYILYDAPLWPCIAIHRMQIWSRFWLRWDKSAHPNPLSGLKLWEDDW